MLRSNHIGNGVNLRGWLFLALLLLCVVLVPYALFGSALETAALQWMHRGMEQPVVVAMLVVALLASDVMLPIPSSVVSVLAALVLGWFAGAIAIAIGLTLGCLIGYAIGRWAGATLVSAVLSASEVERLSRAFARRGALTLIIARAIPVASEASLIAAGAARMPFAKFMLVTTAANILIAAAYSLIGALLAIDVTAAALALTLLLAIVWYGSRFVNLKRVTA